MRKKYLLVGDFVTSRNDRQLHYVSPTALLRLYGLSPGECYLNNDSRIKIPFNLIELRPRPNGDYADHIAKVRV